MIETSRRGFLAGFGALLAAPAIVRVTSIMPIKVPPIILARHPLYDSEEWHAVRQNFYTRKPSLLIPAKDGTFVSQTVIDHAELVDRHLAQQRESAAREVRTDGVWLGMPGGRQHV